MEILDPIEIKLIEKYRECVEKVQTKDYRARHGETPVGREFSHPDHLDSDDTRHISVSVRMSSAPVSRSSTEVKVERAKARL